MARLIGYVRVSRVAGREGDSFISPKVQRDKIAAMAAAGGHTLLEIVEELDASGAKYERPRFQEALAAVERGEADGIAVAKLDRFARSVAGAAKALERLEAAGGVLVAADVGLDTSTTTGRLMRNVLMALAEFEVDRIRESWESARDRAIGRGVHISRVPPLGYRRSGDGRLEPDPETAPVVRELFRRRAAGASWHELAALLDERVPRDGAWPVSTLTALIARRTYLGEARAGSIVNPNAHPPLVTREEWLAAQTVKVPRARSGKSGALLAGLLRCASCGGTLSRWGDGRRGYDYYACRKRGAAAGACVAPAKISLPRADGHVESEFLAWAEKQRVVLTASETSAALEAAAARVETAEAELEAYRDANLISVIGRDAFADGLAKRAADLEAARRELAAQEDASSRAGMLRVDLVATWPALSIPERRQLLAAAIDHVIVTRSARRGKGTPPAERMQIVWTDESAVDVAA